MKNNFKEIPRYMLDIAYNINQLNKQNRLFISSEFVWGQIRAELKLCIRVLELIIYYNDKYYKGGEQYEK